MEFLGKVDLLVLVERVREEYCTTDAVMVAATRACPHAGCDAQLRQDYTDIANTLIANKNLRELVAQATL